MSNPGKSIVVLPAPPVMREFNETIRNAGVAFHQQSSRTYPEAQELFTLVFEDITNLFNDDPVDMLNKLIVGANYDRYADFGELRQAPQWREFDTVYKKFCFGTLSEMREQFGTSGSNTYVYEKHGPNHILFSVYNERERIAHYDGLERMKPRDNF